MLFSNRFDRAGFDINGGMIGGIVGGQDSAGICRARPEGDLTGPTSRVRPSTPQYSVSGRA